MVQLPPKFRQFVVANAGLKAQRMPAPEGVSLVTSHIYTRVVGFYENVNNDPQFMNHYHLFEAFKKTLEFYYPFTGRLLPQPNGRYEIGNFDKGALFEAVDSTDDFQKWKKSNFSYSVVPYEELFPIKSYVGRDSPLFGFRFTYTRCGSCILSIMIHHKIADGVMLTQFLSNFGRVCRGEELDPEDVYVFTDAMRTPLKPLPGVDHTNLYPSYEPGTAPPMNINLLAPSKKVIFSFDRVAVAKMKKTVIAASDDPNLKLSQFEVLIAAVHKAIVKARRTEADHCSDLVYIVGQHHRHPNMNMLNYLGNFIIPVPVSYKAKEVISKEVHEIAQDIRKEASKINIPYMESLEYYLNNAKNVEWIESPAARLGRGAVGVSDWSRFVDNYDFGYGQYTALRSFVDTSPIPLITVMPYTPDTIEVIIQLDIESLDRLVRDRDIMAYVKRIY